jgi:hypothetical protein
MKSLAALLALAFSTSILPAADDGFIDLFNGN